MKKSVVGLARCCAVAAVILGGAAVSEATPITLVDGGGDSVELCLPSSGCGTTYGLSNWVANGTPVTGFSQWFTGSLQSDPGGGPSWSGPLETLGAMSLSNLTSSTVTVAFYNALQGIGITIDYALANIGGTSHILETATVTNDSQWFLKASLTDGRDVNVSNEYIHTVWGESFNLAVANVDYTPTPEPFSMLLLGSGLVAVARSRMRRPSMA
jgi:hypothetical protein